MSGIDWPDHWPPQAREVITQALGSDLRLRIVVGDPAASIDGTVLEGFVQLNGRKVMVAYDNGADRVPWRLLAGPVLRIYHLRPRRRPLVLFADERWTPRRGE